MSYLLDTHALLWWLFDDGRLSRRARGVIRDSGNRLLVSSASAGDRDPFDRMLAAQVSLDGLTLVTADPIFADFGIAVVW